MASKTKMDPNIKRPVSPTTPSLQSLSPERPDLSSGKKRRFKGRPATTTSPSLQSMSPERPDLSRGNTKDRTDVHLKPDDLESGLDCESIRSDRSKENPPVFAADRTNVHPKPDDSESGLDCESIRSDRSKGNPMNFVPKWNVKPEKPPAPRKIEEDAALPPSMEDWTTEHVKHWLTTKLRIPLNVAQNLYESETSGACLVSFEKQDLMELGVPLAPALQILREVKRFNRRSESSSRPHEPESQRTAEDHLETQTVTTDSGFHSESSAVIILQEARDKIKRLLEKPIDKQFSEHTSDQFSEHRYSQVIEHIPTATVSHMKKTLCTMRPFDKSNFPVFYTEHHFLPAVAGPSNLLEPVHEYQLLPDSEEVSQEEALFEFTNEMFCFAASCMNSRTNGTIHFGVKDKPSEEQGHIIGHKISSRSLYSEAFELNVSKYFEQQHITSARTCIRPPVFIQVQREDGTASDKCVIEVDVIPLYSETLESVFYTIFNIPSTVEQNSKTECLFVREGSSKVNILSDSNPRVLQDKIKDIHEKVKHWASARRAAEQRYEPPPFCENQGQRLKQLITRGQDALSNSIQVFVVTDKCHSTQLEHMDFLKELNLFAVLDFDPESAKDGTCHFYRKDRVANLHFPHMYSNQDHTSVIAKLNLFKQTSWIFCNGKSGEEGDLEKPLTPSEWLKKRSGDITNMVSCCSDLLPKNQLLVLIILHSAVTINSNPILETFCALYRSLEGMDNMLCLCKDSTVFSYWKNLVERWCEEDITNKCIYSLSFQEISSTIKTLKEPQTRASRRLLPSTGSSSVQLEKKDEEMMPDLEILCENECEKTEIETNNSFEEFKKKTEEDFYRGGRASWWNFYLSEQQGSQPFIKRDRYNDLHQLICPVQSYVTPCVIVSLFHHPGCGGTTLAMHILWSLKNKFRCAVVKNQTATNKDIALQVRKLLTYGKQDQSGYTPVLLLTDNWNDVEDLRQCIINTATDGHHPNNLLVLILKCERTPFPDEASRNCYNSNVCISAKLSPKEKDLFYKKYEELKDSHDRPDTFYVFMIMKNDFSKDYISGLVNNILKDLDVGSKQGRLLGFLALLNTYVHDSYMSLSLCEELMEIRNPLWRQETLEDKMNPYSTLLIRFTVEEHGTYQAVRLLHQMIAENCLKVFKEHKLKLSDITVDLLNCENIYKKFMGKDFLTQFIHSMLVKRSRREQGDDKNTLFSPLIENIQKEGVDKVNEVLERAVNRFDRSATLPQALARYMCLNEKDFDSALKWALDAQRKKSNSYIADTVGQVYKSHLKKIIEDSKEQSPESLDECLNLASKAVSAFRESQELAKKDEQHDPLDVHFRKVRKSYNTSGYLGETEVIMMLLDLITELPIFPASDKHERDKLLQVLRGNQPVSILGNYKDSGLDAIVKVLKDHGKFLVSLKPRLKEIFTFFENYFIYLRPRHALLQKDTVDDRNKQRFYDQYDKYIELFFGSKKEKLAERERNPNLSLQQVIEDHRRNLEMMQADSFAGILHSFYRPRDKIENIVKKWNFIFENSLRRFPSTSDTVNYILANIVLHCVKPKSSVLKKYEELATILNDTLQREGTRSNMPELYYLCMLLMWPSTDQTLQNFTEYSNITTYITSAKRSFHKRFSFMFPSRSAIAYFFLGKSTGLKRIVSKINLDQILNESDPNDDEPNLHHLWHTGQALRAPNIQKKLLRVKGRSENGEIYVTYGPNIRIQIRPAYLGNIRSGCSREEVSFFIGFTMEGPVAYGVKYEN